MKIPWELNTSKITFIILDTFYDNFNKRNANKRLDYLKMK